jgi:hypothetical protein
MSVLTIIILSLLLLFSFWRFFMNIGFKFGYAWGNIDAVLITPSYIIIMIMIYLGVGLAYVIKFIKGDKSE